MIHILDTGPLVAGIPTAPRQGSFYALGAKAHPLPPLSVVHLRCGLNGSGALPALTGEASGGDGEGVIGVTV